MQAAITPVDKRQLPSLIITTSSGAIQHVNNDKISWTREESLADIAAVRFIDLGEPEVEEVREILSEEAFFGRTLRHISELKVGLGCGLTNNRAYPGIYYGLRNASPLDPTQKPLLQHHSHPHTSIEISLGSRNC